MRKYTFTSDAYGYMLYCNGKPIGGAGTVNKNAKHWRHQRADLKMFADDARRAIADLEAGRIPEHMRAAIEVATQQRPPAAAPAP